MAEEREIVAMVRLRHPIKLGESTPAIEELKFRRGRLGDLRGVPLGREGIPSDALLLVAGRLCGQTSAVMERLDEEDAPEVLDIALGFLGRCLPTGKML